MAMNLTNRVRLIAEVTKAVAKGDHSGKIEVDVRGVILEAQGDREQDDGASERVLRMK